MGRKNGIGGATIGSALADRIERAWEAHPEGEAVETRRGGNRGQRWFARRSGYDQTTVRQWLAGRNEAPPPAIRILEMLEREAGV